jgi:orotidine-5'-phosphate decarboxylase
VSARNVSFARRFATIRDRFGPLVLGVDPHGPLLGTWGLSDDADGLERFADIVLEAGIEHQATSGRYSL